MTRFAARVRKILAEFPRIRATVVGDLVADEFIYGRIDRVSREAPVLILGYDSTEIVPGGAGNAARNAGALGAKVALLGVVGRDDVGSRLLSALQARRTGRVPSVDVRGVIRAASYATPVKTRILAGGAHSAKQQVVRIDRAGGAVTAAIERTIERSLTAALGRSDVVIISDYGGGLITPALWRRARAAVPSRRRPLVLVDSRYALAGFTGATAATPNESEVESLLGVTIDDDGKALERAGRELLDLLKTDTLLITRGSRGMALFQRGAKTDHIPIVGSDQVTDVTGAGDTVIATFALALAAGASPPEAARLANLAGGLVVMKRGTATVEARELLEAAAPRSARTPRGR
jgi:rfaE bifunctional protein kinase chain/domain